MVGLRSTGIQNKLAIKISLLEDLLRANGIVFSINKSLCSLIGTPESHKTQMIESDTVIICEIAFDFRRIHAKKPHGTKLWLT